MTKQGILSLACKVFGVIFLADTVASIPIVISFAMTARTGRDGVNPTSYALSARIVAQSSGSDIGAAFGLSMGRLWAERWAVLIGCIATIVIGLCLVCFARGLSALLYPSAPDSGQGCFLNRE